MIQAFIFDLDGTLFDTMAASIQAYTKAFAAVGLQFDAEKYTHLFGLRFKEMMAELIPDANSETLRKIKEGKAISYPEAFDLVVPNSGLLALMSSVRKDYKTALVTTASPANVTALLKHFQINEDEFDVVITGEEVERGKPDPECYEKAIMALSTPANECCIFEDSAIGVQAARLAGAHVVKVAM
jgi:beta-phosphoglucomutase